MDFLEFEQNDFLDDDPDFGEDILQLTDFDIDDEYLETMFEPVEKEKMRFLNNKDYNLNSPIICDNLNIILENLITGKQPYDKEDFKNHTIFNSLKNLIKRDVTQINNIHQKVGEIFKRRCFNYDQSKNLIKRTNKDANKTFIIVETFFKGWLKKQLTFEPIIVNSDYILSSLEKFLDFHWIVQIINSSTEYEMINLIKTLKYKKVKINKIGNNLYGGEIFSDNMGQISFVEEFVYFHDLNIILDRNLILMIKDTLIARFQTLLYITNYDLRLPYNFPDKMIDIYDSFDNLLILHGNPSYDCIKLIEPVCSLRLAELVKDSRPLLNLTENFRKHIENSILELPDNYEEGKQGINIILRLTNINEVVIVYSSFRHWGHPIIEYKEGLKELHSRVTKRRTVDIQYADMLASDLAYRVLKTQYKIKKRWFVDIDKIDKKDRLRYFIERNIWPTRDFIESYGHNWNKLPLTKCFDIPDMIDQSILYSDKSHSLTRSELKSELRSSNSKTIKSEKVLKSLLEKPATDWKQFLKEIDEKGLDEDHLIIGLKAKERELKRKGRYFALMSWKLREYFVFTEYLIKEHFIKLYKGLTMADDLMTIVKKMMENTYGQGGIDYENITIANHVDYDKWCNTQSLEGTTPTFKVMDKFLGYNNLISRTHEFFEKSLIYYKDGKDKFYINNDNKGVNVDDNEIYCWNGQFGGLEGLRQKGWSIISLLLITRESKIKSTKINILAQGDNQVICTNYKLQKTRDDENLITNINNIIKNNNDIMNAIYVGVGRLGMKINHDETIQSADYLNYGKNLVIRGKIKSLDTKKWSRVTCVTNDQIPTAAGILSSVSSSALGVSHFSDSPLISIKHYNWVGNFVRNLIEKHNPAIRGPISSIINKKIMNDEYKIKFLYLDPSLGGIGGTSLTRFLMRGFPDPITESLAFWKIIHDNLAEDSKLRKMCINIGYPKLSKNNDLESILKLIEDPLSLNIPKGLNPTTMLKELVKKTLVRDVERIKNRIIYDSLINIEREERNILNFLLSINPCFPRFISEFYSSSSNGLFKSVVSLFQNSKTIRNYVHKHLEQETDNIIIKCEIISLNSITSRNNQNKEMWECSAMHGDELRWLSWGREIVGSTVPHPIEMFGFTHSMSDLLHCLEEGHTPNRLITLLPEGLKNYEDSRGPLIAYLGSKTKMYTSILQPWDKETNIPLIKRATKLLDTIGWFVDPNSKLSTSILNNIKSLTGESITKTVENISRTGSHIHRFSSSRQSSGGFTAQGTSRLTRMTTTTDNLDLNDNNYDFMFQSTILYTQMVVGEMHDQKENSEVYHTHLTCKKCLRGVNERFLESNIIFNPIDTSYILKHWKPEATSWFKGKNYLKLRKGKWDFMTDRMKSFMVGKAQGFGFGFLFLKNDGRQNELGFFPIVLKDKLHPHYMEGLLIGLLMAGNLEMCTRRNINSNKKFQSLEYGQIHYLINYVVQHPGLQAILSSDIMYQAITSISHRVPPSYPLNKEDSISLLKNFLINIYNKIIKINIYNTIIAENKEYYDCWIFADINEPLLVNSFVLAFEAFKIFSMIRASGFNTKHQNKLRSINRDLNSVLNENMNLNDVYEMKNFLLCESEIRHSVKNSYIHHLKPISSNSSGPFPINFKDIIYNVRCYKLSFSKSESNSIFPQDIKIPAIQDPMISSLRTVQIATGAFFKISSLINYHTIKYQDFLVGGDGSGGITSLLLRNNRGSKGIYNSLLDFTNYNFSGSKPSPPSAVTCLGKEGWVRCVNYLNVWEEPNDLSQESTWLNFLRIKSLHELKIDLMIFDMEIKNENMIERIEMYLGKYLYKLLAMDGTVIFKTYLGRLKNNKNYLNLVGKFFKTISINQTEISSSFTSEIYIVCKYLRKSNNYTKYPDLSEKFVSSSDYLKIFALETFNHEVERAKVIFNTIDRQIWNYPNSLISCPYNDLGNIFDSLVIESGIMRMILSNTRNIPKENLLNYIFSSLLYGINSVFSITKGYKNNYSIPDSKFKNVGVLLSSYFNFLSLVMDDPDFYLFSKYIIDKGLLIFYKSYKSDNLIFVKWSFKNKYKNYKKFFLDDRIGIIASITRSLFKIWNDKKVSNNKSNREIDLKKVEEILINLNKELTISIIKEKTGIFENPINVNIDEYKASAIKDNVEFQEVAAISDF